MENYDNDAIMVLAAAHRAWVDGAQMRATRNRNKNFTYGRQLDDQIRLPDGMLSTERDAIISSGREPLTNNLIRQLVKSVVGRFRQLNSERIEKLKTTASDIYKFYIDRGIPDIDARALEEFLISGVCVQKVDAYRLINKWQLMVENVSPNEMFVNAVSSPSMLDCEIIGQLHAMSVPEMILRLAPCDRALAMKIRGIYNDSVNAQSMKLRRKLGCDNAEGGDFWNAPSGKYRIFEIWTRETREILSVHDYQNATLRNVGADQFAALEREQRRRKRKSLPPLQLDWKVEQYWHCRWVAPSGSVIIEYDSPFSHKSHPYALKMYPLIDGEIHAFIEDVIDQQKYVNRLITLIDHIMNSSAKGVLLYPTDALPMGMTWEDIRSRWSSPSGIIPYDSATHNVPQQVSSTSTCAGAYELLSLEMKLFDEISGVAGSLRGRETASNAGAELYKEQTRNATIVLLDLIDTFFSFIAQRDNLLANSY